MDQINNIAKEIANQDILPEHVEAMLDIVADYVEDLCGKIKMPCSITGGVLHGKKRTIELDADFPNDPLVNPQRCRTLSTILCGVFHANDAGVDMDGKRIWIYQIQPNAQIADSRLTNKLLS